MSVWVVIMGLAVSFNCLIAWSSESHGAKCLSMWIGAGFMLGLGVTTASKIVAHLTLLGYPLQDLTLFDYPWQNLVMSIADLGLLAWLTVILRRNRDLHDIGRLLIILQCCSLFSHWIDITTLHNLKRLYYGALDFLEALMIVLNLHKSKRNGINLDVLLYRLWPVHSHSSGDGR